MLTRIKKTVQTTLRNLGLKNGKKRLWLDGLRLANIGFVKGAQYLTVYHSDTRQIELILSEQGDRTVSGRKKRGSDTITPIIELCNDTFTRFYHDADRVRATLYTDGRIVIDLHPEDVARFTREERTRDNLRNGLLHEGSGCTGIGVSTLAIHQGLSENGIDSVVDWVIDAEGKYLQVAIDNNPAITDDTQIFEGYLEDVQPEQLSVVDILSISLPCTGHSQSGKSKNKIKHAEQHDDAATSVFGFMNIRRAVNPSIIISENVVPAKDSATYILIKKELERTGYNISEFILDGDDAGTIENRKRYWFVAVSKGLGDFDLMQLPRFQRQHQKLGDVMENDDEITSTWNAYPYLFEKQKRDKAAGKGFAMQIVNSESTTLGTIGRHYNKVRSTEPLIKHSSEPLYRLLTPLEHARVKGIPESLVVGISNTTAHQGLGQSVLFQHAKALGIMVAQFLTGNATPALPFITKKSCEVYCDKYIDSHVSAPQLEFVL